MISEEANWAAMPDEQKHEAIEKHTKSPYPARPVRTASAIDWSAKASKYEARQKRLELAQALLAKLEDYQQTLQEAYDKARRAEIDTDASSGDSLFNSVALASQEISKLSPELEN